MCRPFTNFVCCSCGKQFLKATYAINANSQKICDKCAFRTEVDAMRLAHVANAKYSLYGPKCLIRGATVSNWPGAKLATIVEVGNVPHPFTIRSNWGERYYCKIVDLHGNNWVGWFAEGVLSTIKPVKESVK